MSAGVVAMITPPGDDDESASDESQWGRTASE
jgi:hypothetical protein